MEKDRIQINGVWYVKERTKSEITPNYFLGAIIEKDEYCFEGSVLLKDDSIWEGTFSIEYTDKRQSLTESDFWDNQSFIEGILNRDNEQINVLTMSMGMSKDTIEDLIAFLRCLKDKGWF
jgi:hypothetical protein